MTRNPLLFALVAAAALAGCNKQDHTIVAGPPEDNETNKTAANVVLPPAIVSTKTYRCADNSVVIVDYLQGGTSANVHGKGAAMQVVTAAEAGKPMTADGGYSVDGTPGGSTAKIGVPGHPSQSCKA